VTRAAYTGHEVLTFTDYRDLESGKTLTAEPGGTYDVAPASGRVVPDLPEGWFTVLEKGDDGKKVPPNAEGAPGAAPETAPARHAEPPVPGEPLQQS